MEEENINTYNTNYYNIDGDPKKVKKALGDSEYYFVTVDGSDDVYDSNIAKSYIDNGQYDLYQEYMSRFDVVGLDNTFGSANEYYNKRYKADQVRSQKLNIQKIISPETVADKDLIDYVDLGYLPNVTHRNENDKINEFDTLINKLGAGQDIVRFSFPKEQRGEGMFDWVLRDNDENNIDNALEKLRNIGINPDELMSYDNVEIIRKPDKSGYIQIPKNNKYFKKIAVSLNPGFIYLDPIQGNGRDFSMRIYGVDENGNIIDSPRDTSFIFTDVEKAGFAVSSLDFIRKHIESESEGNHNRLVELYNKSKANYDEDATSAKKIFTTHPVRMENVLDNIIELKQNGAKNEDIDSERLSMLRDINGADWSNNKVDITIISPDESYDYKKYGRYVNRKSTINDNQMLFNYVKNRLSRQTNKEGNISTISTALEFSNGKFYLSITLPPYKNGEKENLAKEYAVNDIGNIDGASLKIYIGENSNGAPFPYIEEVVNLMTKDPKYVAKMNTSLMQDNGYRYYDIYEKRFYYYQNGSFYYKTNNAEHETNYEKVYKNAFIINNVDNFSKYIADHYTTGIGGTFSRGVTKEKLDDVLKLQAFKIISDLYENSLGNMTQEDVFNYLDNNNKQDLSTINSSTRAIYNEVDDVYKRLKFFVNRRLNNDSKL